jgi:uncharacterized protein (DUF3084 family)
MPPADSDPDQALRSVLETFETRLATPIVSGELADWSDALSKAWTDAAIPLQRSGQRRQDQFKQIAAEDSELLPRVQQLQAEDDAIRHDIHKLTDQVKSLAQRARQVEPHEGKLDPEVEALRDLGVAFLNRVRRQEVAVQTWFLEAFNRDRGVAD